MIKFLIITILIRLGYLTAHYTFEVGNEQNVVVKS